MTSYSGARGDASLTAACCSTRPRTVHTRTDTGLARPRSKVLNAAGNECWRSSCFKLLSSRDVLRCCTVTHAYKAGLGSTMALGAFALNQCPHCIARIADIRCHLNANDGTPCGTMATATCTTAPSGLTTTGSTASTWQARQQLA